MISIPSAGRKLSKHSKYSWVAPGPPFNNNNLFLGLLPMVLVHTLNLHFGVSIGMILMPPVCKPESLFEKYVFSEIVSSFSDDEVQERNANTIIKKNKEG